MFMHGKRTGLVSCVRMMLEREGPGALLKGWTVRPLRHFLWTISQVFLSATPPPVRAVTCALPSAHACWHPNQRVEHALTRIPQPGYIPYDHAVWGGGGGACACPLMVYRWGSTKHACMGGTKHACMAYWTRLAC